ncbi:MAG: hypothetical protein ACRDTF_15970 [Pseudonocardiaceae bacterium]
MIKDFQLLVQLASERGEPATTPARCSMRYVGAGSGEYLTDAARGVFGSLSVVNCSLQEHHGRVAGSRPAEVEPRLSGR